MARNFRKTLLNTKRFGNEKSFAIDCETYDVIGKLWSNRSETDGIVFKLSYQVRNNQLA